MTLPFRLVGAVRSDRFRTAVAACAFLGTGLLHAGPLNPPSGAITSTYKTLTQVEPRICIDSVNTPGDGDSVYKITQAGSYYLCDNIIGVAGKHGIKIDNVADVTIDLNGFEIFGAGLDGVSDNGGFAVNVVVRNGFVRFCGGNGINLGNTLNSRVEDVLTASNIGNGVRLGATCSAINCSAFDNVGNGIAGGGGAGSSFTNCLAYNNLGAGISANIGSTVTVCTSWGNDGAGITADNACTITNCMSYDNADSGIVAGSGSRVGECVSLQNVVDGIRVTARCIVTGNSCSFNGFGQEPAGGAGVHATGFDNRIEGNNCISADRGIEVDTAGNFIVRNTCSGNTVNWDVAAGNVCLVVQGVTGGAILGNTGGVAPGSTDPNANFTY